MTGERAMTTSDLEMLLQRRNHVDVCRCIPHAISLVENSRWFDSSQYNTARHLLVFENLSTPLGFVSVMERELDRVANCEFYLVSDASHRTGKSMNFQGKLRVIQQGWLRDQNFDGENYLAVIHFGLLRQTSQTLQQEVFL